MKSSDLQILGLKPGASKKEIKRAYRRLAQELHPDVSPSPDAAEHFNALEDAYKRLTSRSHRYTSEEDSSPTRPAPESPIMDPETLIRECGYAVTDLRLAGNGRTPDSAAARVASEMLQEGLDSHQQGSAHRFSEEARRPPILLLVDQFLQFSYEAHVDGGKATRVTLINRALGLVSIRRVDPLVGHDARAGTKEVVATRIMSALARALLARGVVRFPHPVIGRTDMEVVHELVDKAVAELEAG